MAVHDEPQQDRIVLDDGTWVDAGPNGRWRPTVAERVRAAVVLGVALGALVLLAFVSTVGGDDSDDEVVARASTSEDAAVTTTAPSTAGPLDPASVGGESPSPSCAADDRDARPLRGRRQSIVLVLNATSRAGHAADVTEVLEDLGYEAAAPDNAGRREVTSVAYLAGWCAEAERVAEDLDLPEATVELVPEDLLSRVGRARLVVNLGADSVPG